ncbi:MAG: sodium-dependent transporter [Chlamydiales bacterium]|nr:sodium-dependent transporter [Chlamydiales bacterium]
MGKQANEQGFESEKGYIWSMVGTAIGFANLLGFSSQCYRNGGGAFLIPFFIALFILGIPMLFLEGILGQKSQAPLVTVYRKHGPKNSAFFGWVSVFTVTTIGAFYTVLTSWAVAYSVFALFNMIPQDTATFFSQSFLKSTSSLSEFSWFSTPLLLANTAVVIFTWYVLSKDIKKGIERWCSAFLPILTVMIALFLLTVCFLPGSFEGFWHYIKPDFSKLSQMSLWRDVFGQLFFSLSLGIGIVVGYSRHTQPSTDMRRAMTKVALADFSISFISGFVIFGSIAYMAHSQGASFSSIVSKASTFEIGYIIFPVILKSFPPILSQIFGFLFFFSVFIAGITGLFSIVESVSGNLEVEFSLSRKKAVSIALTVIGCLSFIFCLGNGIHLTDALEPMVIGNIMLVGGIAQILAFMYFSKEIKRDAIWSKNGKRHPYYYCLKYFSLFILLISLFFALKSEWDLRGELAFYVRWLWLAIVCVLSFILTRMGQKTRS